MRIGRYLFIVIFGIASLTFAQSTRLNTNTSLVESLSEKRSPFALSQGGMTGTDFLYLSGILGNPAFNIRDDGLALENSALRFEEQIWMNRIMANHSSNFGGFTVGLSTLHEQTAVVSDIPFGLVLGYGREISDSIKAGVVYESNLFLDSISIGGSFHQDTVFLYNNIFGFYSTDIDFAINRIPIRAAQELPESAQNSSALMAVRFLHFQKKFIDFGSTTEISLSDDVLQRGFSFGLNTRLFKILRISGGWRGSDFAILNNFYWGGGLEYQINKFHLQAFYSNNLNTNQDQAVIMGSYLFKGTVSESLETIVYPGAISPGIVDGENDSIELKLISLQARMSIRSWSCHVLSESGKIIFTLKSNPHLFYLPERIIWNGRDDNGNLQPNGYYKFRVEYNDEAGNNKVIESNRFVIDNSSPDARFFADFVDLKNSVIKVHNMNKDSIDDWQITLRDRKKFIVNKWSLSAVSDYKTINWDGRDKFGVPVPDGRYSLELSSRDDAGNTFFEERYVYLGNRRNYFTIISDQDCIDSDSDRFCFDIQINDKYDSTKPLKLIIKDEAAVIKLSRSIQSVLNSGDVSRTGHPIQDNLSIEKGSIASSRVCLLKNDYTFFDTNLISVGIYDTSATPPLLISELKVFSYYNSLYDVRLKIIPNLFTPDNDRESDFLILYTEYMGDKPATRWNLEIHDINKDKRIQLSGNTKETEKIIWDGYFRDGTKIESYSRYKINYKIQNCSNSIDKELVYFYSTGLLFNTDSIYMKPGKFKFDMPLSEKEPDNIMKSVLADFEKNLRKIQKDYIVYFTLNSERNSLQESKALLKYLEGYYRKELTDFDNLIKITEPQPLNEPYTPFNSAVNVIFDDRN